jgi:molecular chaperone GrpE
VDRRPWASGGEGANPGAEPAEAEEAGPRYPSFVEELRARAEAAERRAADVQDAYRQAESRMDETRRKLSQDVARRVENELSRLGRDLFAGLLPVLDDLDRAMKNADAAQDSSEAPLRAGLDLVRRNFAAALRDQGVERVETAGLPYDPEIAEAVQSVPVGSAEQDGIVLEELSPAWRFRGQTLRPARVRVGRFVAAS